MPLVGGFECLELCVHGIRELPSATSEPRTSTVAQPVPELYLTGGEEDNLHQGPDLHHPVLVGGLTDVGPGLLAAHSAGETQTGPGYNILA